MEKNIRTVEPLKSRTKYTADPVNPSLCRCLWHCARVVLAMHASDELGKLSDHCIMSSHHLGVEPKIGGFPPKWMVKIMVKTLLKLMIWGYHYFWKHPSWQVLAWLAWTFEKILQCAQVCFRKSLTCPQTICAVHLDVIFWLHQIDAPQRGEEFLLFLGKFRTTVGQPSLHHANVDSIPRQIGSWNLKVRGKNKKIFELPPPTWRIIPWLGYVVNNHCHRKSSKDRVVGPLPNGLFMACKWGLLTGEGSKKNNIRIKKKYSRRIKKKIFWGSKKNIPNVENIYDFEGAATR